MANKQNNENQFDNKVDNLFNSIETGIETAFDKLEKGITIASDKLEEKIENFDEEKFADSILGFFKKVGKSISHFSTVTLPKVINFFKSDCWSTLLPFVILVILLLIVIAIATSLRNWIF